MGHETRQRLQEVTPLVLAMYILTLLYVCLHLKCMIHLLQNASPLYVFFSSLPHQIILPYQASFGSSYGDLPQSDLLQNPPSEQKSNRPSLDDDSLTSKPNTRQQQRHSQQQQQNHQQHQQGNQQQQDHQQPHATHTTAATPTTPTHTPGPPPVSLSAIKDQLRAEKDARLAAEVTPLVPA